MALPADKGDGRDLRRQSAVIPVALIADRRGEVFLFEKGAGVNALPVLVDLIDGNAVGLHVVLAGVAAAAGLRDVPGEGRGLGKIGGLNPMNAMAVCADGDIGIALPQKLTMFACPILLELIHPYVGIEPPHIIRAGMAGAAELRDPRFLRRPLKRLVFGQPHVILKRIAAMAVLAAQAELPVDVCRESLDRGAELLIVQSGMTFQTGIFLTEEQNGQGQKKRKDETRAEPRFHQSLFLSFVLFGFQVLNLFPYFISGAQGRLTPS
jgi:hypothetical protein